MSIDLLRRIHAWTEGALSAQATALLLPEFLKLPVWFPGERRLAADGSGKGSSQRLILAPGSDGDLPVLHVWLDDPARQQPPLDVPVLHQSAGALLSYAMRQRFHLVLEAGPERCLLSYDDLLSLRTLMLMHRLIDGQSGTAGRPPPELTPLRSPLLTYCHGQRSVRRAWLVLINSPFGAQATVMLDASRVESHQAELLPLLDPLLPPGVALTFLVHGGDFRPEVCATVSKFPPQYDLNAKQSWMERLRQRLKPAPIPTIELAVTASATPAPSAA